MRRIAHIVVHCTATPQDATVESIQRYWRNVLGWKSPGYHIIVKPDGSEVRLSPDENPTNGVAGHNATSLHVSYIGGVGPDGKKPVDNRTVGQRIALRRIIKAWRAKYPSATVKGHRDFPGVTKACPCFDAIAEYRAK